MRAMSAFEQAGGEPVVRALVERFVDRMWDDPIIGFFFAGKDRARVKLHEYEHAASVLGAGVRYTGRPIAPLHRALKINAGQFRRRLAILRQELERAGLSQDVIDLWLAAQRAMEQQITDGTDCGPR
jgi:truncated hemoglobin YjbI